MIYFYIYIYIYIYININFLFHPFSLKGGVAENWTVSVSVSAFSTSVHFRLLTQAKIWWYRKYFVTL